jgi:hypothetical protein
MKNIIRTSVLLSLAATLFIGAAAQAGVPLPTPPKAKGEACVEDTEYMRRNHMELLKHQRDDTMHRGIRTKKYSLKNCIACHVQPDASGKPPAIDSRDHFCNSCHSYAGVTVDCFQCHATHPNSGK